MDTVDTMGSVEPSIQAIMANENVKKASVVSCEMATGRVIIEIQLKDGLLLSDY